MQVKFDMRKGLHGSSCVCKRNLNEELRQQLNCVNTHVYDELYLVTVNKDIPC